ncbi:MAG: hypothetical protein LBG83_03030 [Oscillospiraceae bacterium]|jgi:hypothetical protein|nr:hypothetical protein [Oscillospiraceae bacterium]
MWGTTTEPQTRRSDSAWNEFVERYQMREPANHGEDLCKNIIPAPFILHREITLEANLMERRER